ncbi:small ribosomal subunit Rsm22 family protein [Bdellovibrio sp. SKB1291214]|uniref:small ribosomal subunit Rsm22 family protein n=1 Tax=Bdellovibrio sp. SKB1291214 TaxID=1732569 RepID=UPI000B5192DC|nr:small ribosomal subunit Rsm22 family protein [Bdellovibrio sp. SKB1291214]UYL09090.1 small ribosomal subunit Rsm22 family protein [Bdellovibrio sp. SKB1291214]
MQRQFTVPANFEEAIAKALADYKLTLKDSKELAKCVLALSDFFITQPDGQTPWHEPWAQVAYLCYYLPLNAARLRAVISEGEKRGFFAGLEEVIDFGAGLATASLSLSETQNLKYTLIERAAEPQRLIEKHFPFFKSQEWLRTFNGGRLKNPTKTMALFSYSLTELSDLPDWAYECEALFIAEPSTQQDGRKLLQLRAKLLEKGFHAWAPCTHEGPCPLLAQSKTDWCHDRIHFNAPEWFLAMEEQLPMKNRTLTTSFLLMRKQKPTAIPAARVVGDTLKEKGKDRQMICRGPDREFLAWMHKFKIQQEIPRGSLIEIPEGLQKVSNELRVQQEIQVL